MDRGTEEPSNEINAEVAAEWEREYGEFDKSKLAFPGTGVVPPSIAGSYEPYLPGIDGPGMFDPPAKFEEKSWAENMAHAVGLTYIGTSGLGIGYGAYQAGRVTSGAPWRMKVNALFNYCGKHSRELGNRSAAFMLFGFFLQGMTQYVRRRRDYYNVIPPTAVVGSILGFRKGIYTSFGGGVAGAAFATVGAGVWQRYDGEDVLPELQRITGITFLTRKKEDENYVVSSNDHGEELVLEEPMEG